MPGDHHPDRHLPVNRRVVGINSPSARIEPDWIKEYFRTGGTADDEEDALLDSAAVQEWLQDAPERRTGPVRPDSREELRARLNRRA